MPRWNRWAIDEGRLAERKGAESWQDGEARRWFDSTTFHKHHQGCVPENHQGRRGVTIDCQQYAPAVEIRGEGPESDDG